MPVCIQVNVQFIPHNAVADWSKYTFPTRVKGLCVFGSGEFQYRRQSAEVNYVDFKFLDASKTHTVRNINVNINKWTANLQTCTNSERKS